MPTHSHIRTFSGTQCEFEMQSKLWTCWASLKSCHLLLHEPNASSCLGYYITSDSLCSSMRPWYFRRFHGKWEQNFTANIHSDNKPVSPSVCVCKPDLTVQTYYRARCLWVSPRSLHWGSGDRPDMVVWWWPGGRTIWGAESLLPSKNIFKDSFLKTAKEWCFFRKILNQNLKNILLTSWYLSE